MHGQSWLDELRRQLTRKRLPPAYVARFVEELSDHVTDFLEDQMSTDALQTRSLVDRIGAPHEVARQAAREFTQRSFCGRHPILMFVMLPVLAMAGAYMASLYGVVGAGRILKAVDPGISSDSLSPMSVGMMRLLCIGSSLIPATLTAALFGWLAARAGVKRRWPMITGAILGVLAGLSQMDMYVSPLPGKSSLTMGFGFGTNTAIIQLAKFAVPLAIALWIFSRGIRRRATPLAT